MIKYTNGDVFKGEFKNNKREGYGEYKWNNGDMYKGEWVDDKCTGKGDVIRK